MTALRRAVRAARNRIGRRGSALLFFAFIDVVNAWSMLTIPPERYTPTYRWFDSVAPLWVWAALWAAAGTACLYHAVRVDDHLGFVAAIGVKAVWSLGLTVGWVLADVPLLGAVVWLVLAAFVWLISGWPEPDHVDKDLAA